jgi:hypothetical protein
MANEARKLRFAYLDIFGKPFEIGRLLTIKAYPVDAGVATSCGALPPGGTPVFRCWDM